MTRRQKALRVMCAFAVQLDTEARAEIGRGESSPERVDRAMAQMLSAMADVDAVSRQEVAG